MAQRKGEHHHSSQLTEEKVREIRRRYAFEPHERPTMKDLASAFGVSAPAICHVITRKSWKHVA